MGTKIVYNHKAIEKKWREKWEETPVNPRNGKDGNKKPKYYCLDMFPYPSGNGLHVGHWRGYVISDVWSRYKLQQGYYIIHPMGWDAFGLPAENYAIKMGVHPAKSTEANITNIKRQINDIAALYDWDMEVNTTDPEFYKWTQWIFVKMFKEGLAYEKEFPINWCPSCKTGLANEEVVNGKCERCGAEVTKKNLRQWMLRITKYADRLLNDLDKLDWPEKVKKMQADWIGKSYGAEVDFPVEGRDEKITVYTTRPDTLHGATFMVLAPEHELAASLATDETREAVEKYIYDASMKSNVDRMQDKEKTGVFTGSYAINPLNGAKTPIWLSDYVLADYGTGAIMCVPAHDDRDFEFATKFNIPIIQVIAKDGEEIENMTEAYTDAVGTMINSGEWNGMESSVLKKEAPHMIEKMGIGRATVNYKLRDWVFSRQRYWGEPIPIIHCPKCGNVPVPEEELPLRLPEVDSYEPTGTGESPLAAIDEWVNCKCPVCGSDSKRETNTMPQWAGSSWYFLRYVDNHNSEALVSREKADEMLPVDMYIGGVEHAVLHLLYSRFYTKFLCDIGAIDFDEPFHKLFNQGMITGKNGIKMSKSKGNVIYADDMADLFGVDATRYFVLHEMPFENDGIITWDLVIERYNSDLANILGNLVNRTISMSNKYFDGVVKSTGVTEEVDADLKAVVTSARDKVAEKMKNLRVADAITEVFNLFRRCNKYIDETAPWVLAKDEAAKDRLAEVLYNLVESITIGACLLKSFLPETADRILAQLNAGMREYDDLDKFGLYENGNKVTDKPEILFARLDAKEIMPKIDAIREAQKAEFEAEQKALGGLPETTEESGEAIDIEAKPEIEYDDFMKMQFQVGEIISCEAVPKSKKLLCSQVKIGSQVKQIVSGIRKYYTPEEMVGKKVMVLVNLKPAKLAGVLSEGMLLCAEDAEGNLALMTPEKAMPSGAEIC